MAGFVSKKITWAFTYVVRSIIEMGMSTMASTLTQVTPCFTGRVKILRYF